MDKFSALGMFVATAEQGSFSRAAELLGKTPSALTKAVGHLGASWARSCSSAAPGASC